MMLPFSSVNLPAVIVTTIAIMILGMLWYGPLFGKKWMMLAGVKMDKKKGMGMSVAKGLVNTFVGAYVLALVLVMSNPTSLKSGLILGGILWLGFSATTEASDSIWGGRPWALFLINGLFCLVGTMISVAILMNFPY